MKKAAVWVVTVLLMLVFGFGVLSAAAKSQKEGREDALFNVYHNAQAESVHAEELYYQDYKYKYKASLPENVFPDMAYKPSEYGVCAPVAGANIAAYYDIRYPNMVSGVQSYVKEDRGYTYSLSKEKEIEMQSIMERYMKSAPDGGTTEENAKAGLQNYARDQGYSLSYNYLGLQTNLKIAGVVEALQRGNPVLLFCSKYNIVQELSFVGNYRIMKVREAEYNHVMVAWGIMVIDYYIANFIVSRDVFLRVSWGGTNLLMEEDYYRVNGFSKLVSSYEIILK